MFLLLLLATSHAAFLRLLHAAPSEGESRLQLQVNGSAPLLNSSYGVFSGFIAVDDGVANLTLTINKQTFVTLAKLEAGLHFSVALSNPTVGSAPRVSVLDQNFTLSHALGPDKVKLDVWSLYALPSLESCIALLRTAKRCYDCAYYTSGELCGPGSRVLMPLSADSDITLRAILPGLETTQFDVELYPRSVYTVVLLSKVGTPATMSFVISTEEKGPWMYLPIVVACIIFISLYLFSVMVHKCIKQRENRHTGGRLYEEHSLAFMHPEPSETTPSKPSRLKSLDTFRGISLCVMMFANKGGGGYWFFNHSSWNGLTFADLVFPWFIFMMGCSMALSFKGVAKSEPSYLSLLWKVCKRSAILFCLGLFVNGGDDFRNWRVPGVLQRFGVSFFMVSLIVILVPGRLLDTAGESRDGLFADLTPFLLQWVVIALLITTWLCLTFLLPVPGCPTGYLGPGGVGDQGAYMGCTGGAAGYIDQKVFGLHHMYLWPTCVESYSCNPFDPEGLLGCLTSVVITYLGYQTGRIVTTYKEHRQRLVRWVIWGSILCLIAGALCGFKQDGGTIPVNKNLWSLSFVFVMAGFGMLALSMCYVVVDVWGLWSGKPFYFVGMNSIAVYLLSEVVSIFPFSYVVYDDQTYAKHLTECLVGVCMYVLVAYFLFHHEVFIKV